MTNKWQEVGVVLVSALAIAAGCGGGGKKEASEPDGDDDVVVEPDEDDDDSAVIIPEEKFDEINSFFSRKRRLVTRCFVEAEEAGEVSKDAKVDVMVTVTIQKSGQITNAKIAKSSHESEVLQNCVLEYVKSWTVTTLPRSLDYSYSFGMGEL